MSRLRNAVEAMKSIINEYGQTHYIVPPPMDLFLQEPILDAAFSLLQANGTLESQDEVNAEAPRFQQAIQSAVPDIEPLVQKWRAEKEKELLALVARCPSLVPFIPKKTLYPHRLWQRQFSSNTILAMVLTTS